MHLFQRLARSVAARPQSTCIEKSRRFDEVGPLHIQINAGPAKHVAETSYSRMSHRGRVITTEPGLRFSTLEDYQKRK